MADFRLKLDVPVQSKKINIQDTILLSGSCFSEHMAHYLSSSKFPVLDNPNGILFNPVSVCTAIESYIENRQYKAEDLFEYNGIWHSWDHHSRFSHTNAERALQMINESQQQAHAFLKKAQWLIITIGSAFVYEWIDKDDPLYPSHRTNPVVANCHKVPGTKFNKRLLTVEEVLACLGNTLYRLQLFNPTLKLIFTISPVRHLRDGLIENNKSKATLIQAVHQLVEKFDGLFYFPAYELVIDDLRDYRFYAEDMVHPNYLGTEYVWEEFQKACINPKAQPLIKEMARLNTALQHRPMHPDTAAFRQFLQSQYQKVEALQQQYPAIDFSKELAYFKRGFEQ